MEAEVERPKSESSPSVLLTLKELAAKLDGRRATHFKGGRPEIPSRRVAIELDVEELTAQELSGRIDDDNDCSMVDTEDRLNSTRCMLDLEEPPSSLCSRTARSCR